MASTQSAFSSSGVPFGSPRPAPPFSTLTTAKSMPIEETMSGRSSRTARRPGEPYTSATKRMFTSGRRSRGLPGVLHGAGLPDHDHLDLARILELPLDAPRHV